MATYCVSFRIANQTVGGETYQDRYDRLISNVHDGCDGFWAETTSFILVGSDLDTVSFATKASAGLSARHDTVLVFDPDDMSAAVFGKIERLDILESFFKVLQKAG